MTAFLRGEQGMVMLETTLAIVVLIPMLFAILQFGWLMQRWIAQEGVAVQSARMAGELGGDRPGVRAYVAEQLRLVGIEPSRVRVEIEPARVGWREPVRVSLRTDETVSIPLLLTMTVPLQATAVARGEVNR